MDSTDPPRPLITAGKQIRHEIAWTLFALGSFSALFVIVEPTTIPDLLAVVLLGTITATILLGSLIEYA